MSRINILNASVEEFQIEVFASAPVDGSSGDYEDGRIVKFATHFYMWHDASGEWKKFGNSTDITSLETRLSVQESSQAVAEASMVAIDSSLQTRISTEEAARSSSIDSAETRAEAAEAVISGNLSSEVSARIIDVEAEATRAASAEVVLSTNLSSGVAARIVDVEAEATRAGAAEGSLQTRLAAEESNELAAEGSLNTREGAEESARLAGDDSLAAAISSEASLARAEEGSLETRLSSEEDRVDAILNASTADKDTFVETVSYINSVDVAHDAQTSTEISSIKAAFASAEAARISDDSTLQTRLSTEESAEASAEASLNTRMAAEESIELSAEGSLDARMSAEESLRLAEDGSLETSLSGAGSSRASGDSSLTTAASVEASTARSAELSVQSSISAAALARGTADASLTTRLSIEESAMIVAVDSIEALRSAGDLSLTTRVAAEESVEASAEASLDARISTAIAARNSEDDSLETRLIAEESNELSAEASLDSRVSSEASAQVLADGSLETRFSGEISVEKSKLDAILDSASADKDTFVEIVSFITSVDTESDDALASYVVTIDSAISTEASTARSAEAVLSAGVSSEASAMTSALAATYSVQKAAIDVHAGNITDAEQHEGVGRHMRVDFTSQTSFTVAAVDLPSNFEPGNGMVQVFQDMGSNKFRHLVAPASYDASTGAMSFDLGSTAKSGFVVFYSFAGDESSVSEILSSPQITGISSLSSTQVVASVSGLDATNKYLFMGTSSQKIYYRKTGSSSPVAYAIDYNDDITISSDYSTVTFDLPGAPLTTAQTTMGLELTHLGHDASNRITFDFDSSYNVSNFSVPSVSLPSRKFGFYVATGVTVDTSSAYHQWRVTFGYGPHDYAGSTQYGDYGKDPIAYDFLTNNMAQPGEWKLYGRRYSTSTTYATKDVEWIGNANSNDVTESWGTYYGYVIGNNDQNSGFSMQINKGNGASTHGTYAWTNAGWYEFQLVYEGSDKADFPIVITYRQHGTPSSSNRNYRPYNNISAFTGTYSSGDGT